MGQTCERTMSKIVHEIQRYFDDKRPSKDIEKLYFVIKDWNLFVKGELKKYSKIGKRL